MSTSGNTDTPTEDFAWASVERALAFSKALTDVMVSDIRDEEAAASTHVSNEFDKTTLSRVSKVLDVLYDFSPIKHATFWALKDRARYGALIATTELHKSELTPANKNLYKEFVCGFDESNIGAFLRKHREKRRAAAPVPTKGVVFINDIHTLPEKEIFYPPEKLKEFGIRKALCFPIYLDEMLEGRAPDTPHFVLNVYPGEIVGDPEKAWLPPDFIFAVQDKLVSGIRALLNRRLVRITEAMSQVEILEAGASARLAMDRALSRVFPKFLMCEQVIRVDVSTEGHLRASVPFSVHEEHSEESLGSYGRLPENYDAALQSIFATKFSQNGESNLDTVTILRDEIKEYLGDTPLQNAASIMVSRIHNRASPGRPRGYIIVVNRLNDYAIHCDPNARIVDHFDWQDERIVAHVGSILDFIAELFTAEESRFARADILSHELTAPTSFIRGTAERIHLAMSGEKKIALGKQRKEMSDIIDTCDLQRLLIHSLLFGFQNRDLPPIELYKPELQDIDETASYVKRLSIPNCQNAGILHERINMRVFPRLFIDPSAIMQVFWNVLANAIKYRDPFAKEKFHFKAWSEKIPVTELTPTEAPESLRMRLSQQRVTSGYLFSFEDHGLGVPGNCRERIFSMGVRADDELVHAQPGAGIGLAVTRAILNDHFGDIWLEHLSGPTVFCAFLPSFLETDDYTNFSSWQSRS